MTGNHQGCGRTEPEDQHPTDIHPAFTAASEYTSFQVSTEHAEIDHILDHKTRLNKCRRTEIVENDFTDHNGIKLEASNREQKKLQTIEFKQQVKRKTQQKFLTKSIKNEWNPKAMGGGNGRHYCLPGQSGVPRSPTAKP